MAQQTHDLINVYRLSQELPALTFNNDVANVALEHSRNMAAGRVPFSHDGFDQRMSTLAKKIKFNTAAENVAFNQGYQDPAAIAVEGWLMSTGHLANITSDFDVTGIGVATNEKKGYYFTQIFVKTN
ncbi:CAP domain-containing protein [candidate division KSB1 bacterium]|nr:CAP domain-containing protein [candidate division KSB1 bacterium]RQW00778.1 MAG: CAP domain-containing protein [candidate division KSB1 bacterium]